MLQTGQIYSWYGVQPVKADMQGLRHFKTLVAQLRLRQTCVCVYVCFLLLDCSHSNNIEK